MSPCPGSTRASTSLLMQQTKAWMAGSSPGKGNRVMAAVPVVIVGASHAGFQVAASLRQAGFGETIKLIGDEPVLPYQRPPLSKDYLGGKIGFDLLVMRPEAFY